MLNFQVEFVLIRVTKKNYMLESTVYSSYFEY